MTVPTVHPFEFDPTYAMSRDMLLAVEPPEAVAGFDAFWAERYRQALAVDPMPAMLPSKSRHAGWEVFDLAYRSTGDFRIGGWLLLPRNGEIRRGLVVGHGYGGRDAPDFDIPVENTAILFPCFRGLSRSAAPPISSDAGWHVLHDIDDPDRYIIGGCVEDLWLAVSTLIALYPAVEGSIAYSGISFGGGIGALAIPHDPRIGRGYLEVPTFGHRPLWMSLPTTGSARAVQAYGKRHPGIAETLRLFDAAVAATRISVPMLVAPALFDPAVAPPCQFAVANGVPPSRFNETFILDTGHFDYDGAEEQHGALRAKLGQFLEAR